MFERFTEQAREVVVQAQIEARLLRHGYIGTEHVLLGLAHEEEGVAASSLRRIGVDLNSLRESVRRIIGEGHPPQFGPDDADALRGLGIDLEEVRRRTEEAFGPGALDRPRRRRGWRRERCEPRISGHPGVSGHVPFTPRAKKALELSLREALQLGHKHIGSEHILLGLIREGEGMAATLLGGEKKTKSDELRSIVIEQISQQRGQGSRPA